MTRDDIIRMAQEAGFTDADNGRVWITDGYWDDELARFAALVAAAEREWQGLTGQEVNHLLAANVDCAEKLIRAIEAKLREKNT